MASFWAKCFAMGAAVVGLPVLAMLASGWLREYRSLDSSAREAFPMMFTLSMLTQSIVLVPLMLVSGTIGVAVGAVINHWRR